MYNKQNNKKSTQLHQRVQQITTQHNNNTKTGSHEMANT